MSVFTQGQAQWFGGTAACGSASVPLQRRTNGNLTNVKAHRSALTCPSARKPQKFLVSSFQRRKPRGERIQKPRATV